jgi:hypothetical protein
MASTVYETQNAEFSNAAHLAAQTLLYPAIFKTDASKLKFESTLLEDSARGAILDGEMGVDRMVHVEVEKLHQPLVFTVQERFRRPEWLTWQDLTVTEWNNASSLPSELYKINAGLFLYAYYDETAKAFCDAICINTTGLMQCIATGGITYTKRRNKKQQDFLAFKFDALHKAGLVTYRLKEPAKPEPVFSPEAVRAQILAHYGSQSFMGMRFLNEIMGELLNQGKKPQEEVAA